jgi:nucleoid-associated protein YgaU
MNKKRILSAGIFLVFTLFIVTSLCAETLAENEWYQKSKEYLAKAEQAFEEGDYDKGYEYAQLADEYAQKAENDGNKMLIKYQARDSKFEASYYLGKAREVNADTNPNTADLYDLAKTEYENGIGELNKVDSGEITIDEAEPILTQAIDYFQTSTQHSKDAIAAINDIATIQNLLKNTRQGLKDLINKGYITKGDADDEQISGMIQSGEEAYNNKDFTKAKEDLKAANERIASLAASGEARAMYGRAEEDVNAAREVGIDQSNPDEFNTATQLLAEAKEYLDNEQYSESIEKSQAVIDTLQIFGAVAKDVLPKYYKVRLRLPKRDCFWRIAAYSFVYGNAWKWRLLYEANKDKIPQASNPHLIEVDMIMEIPSLKGERREGTYDPYKEYTPINKIKVQK